MVFCKHQSTRMWFFNVVVMAFSMTALHGEGMHPEDQIDSECLSTSASSLHTTESSVMLQEKSVRSAPTLETDGGRASASALSDTSASALSGKGSEKMPLIIEAVNTSWMEASLVLDSMLVSTVYTKQARASREWILRGSLVSVAEPKSADGEKPDLFHVAKLAAAAFLCMAVLDIGGHVADWRIEDEAQRAKADHMIDSIAAIIGFIVCFLAYGIIQEFILTSDYGGDKFPDAAFLILTDRLFLVGFSGTAILLAGLPLAWSPSAMASIPGLLSLFCSYLDENAFAYLTFPVIAVFKSSKLVPTMAVDSMVNGARHAIKDYVVALFIIIGVSGFIITGKKSSHGAEEASPALYIGVVMMILSLIGGAFECTMQKKVFDSYPAFSHLQMMFVTGLYATAGIVIMVAATDGFEPLLTFLAAHPECKYHMLMSAVTLTLGIYFILYTVDHLGPVSFQIASVFKQVLSIIMSAILYHHPLTALSMCFAALTIAAVMVKPISKLLGAPDKTPPKVGPLRAALNVSKKVSEAMGYRRVRYTITTIKAVNRFRRVLHRHREAKKLEQKKVPQDEIMPQGVKMPTKESK